MLDTLLKIYLSLVTMNGLMCMLIGFTDVFHWRNMLALSEPDTTGLVA